MPGRRSAISWAESVPLLKTALVFFTVSWCFCCFTIILQFCSAISVPFLKEVFRTVKSCLISSIVKYMKSPSAIKIKFLSWGMSFVHALSSTLPAIIVTRSLWGKAFFLTAIESGRSRSNQRIFPLSTRSKRLSKPQPMFTIAESGFFAIISFRLLSSMIVRATTPSCDMNLS